MQALGLLFILGSVLLGRQVLTGRVKETPQDIKAITLSVLSGDFPSLKDTLSQRGTNVSPPDSGVVAAGTGGEAALGGLLTQGITGDLLAECVRLGNAAKGYRMGGTGPDYYDCSGLVWRAMVNLGVYNGPRFTTGSFISALGNKVVKETAPIVGDVVLWEYGIPSPHMGVVSGPDQFYSAQSTLNGIKFGSISQAGIRGPAPTYWRLSAVAQSGIQGK